MKMKAMVLHRVGHPLVLEEVPVPEPSEEEILVRIKTCGVCRTDLHIVDGDLPSPKLPLIPGHEIIGTVEKVGSMVKGFRVGDRVGVPWLAYTCGECKYCRRGKENLCENALFTGYTKDGGYAHYTVAHYRYAFHIPDEYDDLHAAPLMCAGLIGYRSYRFVKDEAQTIGIYGFGAAAHIITQIAVAQGKRVFAFTRPGDTAKQKFALSLGAEWAGGSDEEPPVKLDAAIIYAPVGPLMVKALRDVDRGGRVVSAGIHMSDIPSFPYRLLWEERSMHSVANLTRQDGEEFFETIKEVMVRTKVNPYPLEEANRALDDLRNGRFEGAAVLVMED